jgi:hypothetical protein
METAGIGPRPSSWNGGAVQGRVTKREGRRIGIESPSDLIVLREELVNP